MPSGFDRMGPYPLWLRRRFKSISLEDAFRLVRRLGVRSTIPTDVSMMIVLSEGDRLLIEPCRDHEGRPKLGYYFLLKEDYPAEAEIPRIPRK